MMSILESTIEKSAREFAQAILTAVRGATLEELLALQGGPKRGRPPKAKPGRKPGRPRKVTAKAVKIPAKKTRKINYPKCSVPRCNKNRYARGNGMCGEHFKASKAS